MNRLDQSDPLAMLT